MKFKSLLLIALAGLFIFSSCKKEDEPEDPIIPNEEEVITTLRFTLTPDGGGEDLVFEFKDLDGDGGTDPVFILDTLAANTNYSGSLTLLNEQEDPAENITEEIEEEDEDHQFFFSTTVSDLVISYNDMDDNGDPVGLLTTVETGVANSGQLTITLRHEPDKGASGVSDGDITNAGGETDIEIIFDIEVE